MSEHEEQRPKPLWMRQAPITIAGVLLLAILASTLYDLLVKPGLTEVGRVLLSIVTFGSKSLRDAAYDSAALDPTPISALIILQVGVVLVAFPALHLLTRRRSDQSISGLEKDLTAATDEERKSKLIGRIDALRRKRRRLKVLFWVMFVPWWFSIFLAYQVHNQSVIIWRVFHANLNILTPAISSSERSELLARFSAMRSRDDYQPVIARMRELARQKALALRNEDTW